MAVDLTVRGGGVFGLAIAWECARRGASVRLIETRSIGAGASGGPVGALAPHVPENWNAKKAFQLDSLLMADAFWAGVAAAAGLSPGYARTGRLQPLADAAAIGLAEVRGVSAASLWQGRAEWQIVRAQAGWGPTSPTGWWVQDTLSARLQPPLACAALAAALRAAGGEIVIGAAADAGRVIWATGVSGLDMLTQSLGVRVGDGQKGQALAVRFAAPGSPQIFADGLHLVPHADGTVAIGSTSERMFGAPDQVDGQLDVLLARAVAVCPLLAGAPVVARWAGLRPRAASRSPVLGKWPGRHGHFVANGGFKTGFGMAPKVAQVMADLVLEGRDAIPEGFRVSDCR